MITTGQTTLKKIRTFPVFLFFLLFSQLSIAQQNPLDLFPDFKNREEQRERFIQELIQLDSILQYDDYLRRVPRMKWETLTIEIKKKVLNLEFPDMFCKDYRTLLGEDKLKNLQRLKDEGKLVAYCRGVASDLDVLPQRSGDIKKDCETYLALIKKIINNYKNDLGGLTFEGYMEMERNENISNDSKRFSFRKMFLQFLNETYHVSFE